MDTPERHNMNFESPFSNANFNNLKPGDFFLHPLAGGHSPAIKVVRADKVETAVDLNLVQQDQSRLPTLTEPDTFKDLTVIAVKAAVIRPKPGLLSIKNGAGGAGSIGRAALVILPTGTLIIVRGPSISTLAFDVVTGHQASKPDSAQCLWTTEWQILIKEGEKELVIFERKS
jgi:hypothetical protein